jgi:hypothetical protein
MCPVWTVTYVPESTQTIFRRFEPVAAMLPWQSMLTACAGKAVAPPTYVTTEMFLDWRSPIHGTSNIWPSITTSQSGLRRCFVPAGHKDLASC